MEFCVPPPVSSKNEMTSVGGGRRPDLKAGRPRTKGTNIRPAPFLSQQAPGRTTIVGEGTTSGPSARAVCCALFPQEVLTEALSGSFCRNRRRRHRDREEAASQAPARSPAAAAAPGEYRRRTERRGRDP